MKLATIEVIHGLASHPNADKLEIAQVLGYQCIVQKGRFYAGEAVVFIQPDSVLPDKPWFQVFKAKSNRVKAIRLRGALSQGICYPAEPEWVEGQNVAEILGVTVKLNMGPKVHRIKSSPQRARPGVS